MKKESNLNDYQRNGLIEFQNIMNERLREQLNFDSTKKFFYKFIKENVVFGT